MTEWGQVGAGAAGGAASGAATGASVGGPWGAAIGAVVGGGIGGLSAAASGRGARKARDEQRRILLEQNAAIAEYNRGGQLAREGYRNQLGGLESSYQDAMSNFIVGRGAAVSPEQSALDAENARAAMMDDSNVAVMSPSGPLGEQYGTEMMKHVDANVAPTAVQLAATAQLDREQDLQRQFNSQTTEVDQQLQELQRLYSVEALQRQARLDKVRMKYGMKMEGASHAGDTNLMWGQVGNSVMGLASSAGGMMGGGAAGGAMGKATADPGISDRTSVPGAYD